MSPGSGGQQCRDGFDECFGLFDGVEGGFGAEGCAERVIGYLAILKEAREGLVMRAVYFC